jgi:hypothetical protein
MLPGPDRILECPRCGTLARQYTLLSGNTFGAQLWSDGWFDAPMLPSAPAIVVCEGCDELYWTEDAVCVGEEEWSPKGSPAAWRAAKPLRRPTLEQYYAYVSDLDSGAADLYPDREILARVLTWRADNDRRRSTQVYPPPPPVVPPAPRFYRNLERLLVLLSDEPEHRLMKAEIRREMRHFGEALALLTFDFPEELQRSAECIRQLSRDGIAVVRPIA